MIKYIFPLCIIACTSVNTDVSRTNEKVILVDAGQEVSAEQTVIYPAPITDTECSGVFCNDPVCLIADGTEWDYSYILTLDQIGGIQSVAKHYHRQELLCELHNGFVYWRASEGKNYPEFDGGSE